MATPKNTNNKDKSAHTGLKVAGVIGGIAAATAAGVYFMNHNKTAQKKVKEVKGWVVKAKQDVLAKVKKLKEVNEEMYNNAIEGVMARYKKLSSVDGAELATVTKELKSHWKKISKELKGGAKAVVAGAKSVKSAVKTVVKGGKAAPKAAAKPKAKAKPSDKAATNA